MIQVWAEFRAVLFMKWKALSKHFEKCQPPRTSSSDKACLNTLIVVLTSTKGRDLPAKTPTLETVSLSINHSVPSILRRQLRVDIKSTHHTPTNSMGTGRQNVSLNPRARASSLELVDL